MHMQVRKGWPILSIQASHTEAWSALQPFEDIHKLDIIVHPHIYSKLFRLFSL